MTAFRFVKPTLLSALLVLSPVTTAFAETVEVMVLNTRGEDGIYRPALRVIRGGTVTFIAAGAQGLTEAILRDEALLNAWLTANISGDGTPLTFVITEIRADPPAVKDCFAGGYGADPQCTYEEEQEYCDATVPGWRIPLNSSKKRWDTPEEYCRD